MKFPDAVSMRWLLLFDSDKQMKFHPNGLVLNTRVLLSSHSLTMCIVVLFSYYTNNEINVYIYCIRVYASMRANEWWCDSTNPHVQAVRYKFWFINLQRLEIYQQIFGWNNSRANAALKIIGFRFFQCHKLNFQNKPPSIVIFTFVVCRWWWWWWQWRWRCGGNTI